MLEGLDRFLRLASVSTDAAHEADMERTTDFLLGHVSGIGLQNAQLLDGGGHKAVYAEWLGAEGAPTFLLYGHYDVQPPDPLDLWSSSPFEPSVRDGRIYGRGTSDNKGPQWTMLCALEACLATTGRLPINVKLLLEGEEEVGSRTLPTILERHGDKLRGHTLISSDGSAWRTDLVSVNVNSRGLAALEFTVTTADADLHSGRYGGPVANAATTLCHLVATLHDADRKVAVAGFFDGLRPPSNSDRASIASIGFDEAKFLGEIGAKPGAGERGVPFLEGMWLRPTLEINGIWGGYQGPGTKTVLPHSASAKITCRLGVGQEPAAVLDAVERHLQAHSPPWATLSVHREPGGATAYAIPEDNAALLALERVLATIHGQKPLHVGVGGTLPISSLIKQHLGMETVMVSAAVSDSNVHAPDEFIRLSSFDEGLRIWLMLLPELAKAS